MKPRDQHFKINHYNSVRAIPEETWDFLNRQNNLYIQKDYLTAIENNHPEISFLYTLVRGIDNQLAGFLNTQLFEYQQRLDQKEHKNIQINLSHYLRKLILLRKSKSINILCFGSAFISGNHCWYFHPKYDKEEILPTLVKEVEGYYHNNADKGTIDFMLIKDFNESELSYTHQLTKLGFSPFKVDPNMVFIVNKKWHGFQDYLDSLKTKFRVKAKKAMSLSQDLRAIDLDQKTVQPYLEEMSKLYVRVVANANFNLTQYNLNSFPELLKKLNHNYVVRAYFYEENMVGFLSGLTNQETLDTHFVGIDYQLNRKMAIYQRMLYDYISMGIEKKLSQINFGRTASEIKSSIGAFPQDLTIYIKHKKSLTNKFLGLFLRDIQPTEFNQKYPFKKVAKE